MTNRSGLYQAIRSATALRELVLSLHNIELGDHGAVELASHLPVQLRRPEGLSLKRKRGRERTPVDDSTSV